MFKFILKYLYLGIKYLEKVNVTSGFKEMGKKTNLHKWFIYNYNEVPHNKRKNAKENWSDVENNKKGRIVF